MRLNKDKQIQVNLPDVRWLARDEDTLRKLLPSRDTWLSTRCRNCDAVLEISGNWPGGHVDCPACGHSNPLPSRDAIGLVHRTCHNCGSWVAFFRRTTDQDRRCPCCGTWLNKAVKILQPKEENNPEDNLSPVQTPDQASPIHSSPLNKPRTPTTIPPKRKNNPRKKISLTIRLRAIQLKNSSKQKKSPLIKFLLNLLDGERQRRLQQRRLWNRRTRKVEKGVPEISGWKNWNDS